jgi:hypothetical protein
VILKIVNFVAFQVGWFACVLGAAAGRPWLGPVVVAGVVALHLALRRPRGPEILLLLSAGVMGYFMDSVLVLGGVINFTPEARLGGPSALWMVAMWVNLGTTLNLSLGWLRERYLLAAAIGAISGPLAYWAGVRLEAVTFGLPLPLSLSLVSVEWVVSMPALIGINAVLQTRAARQDDAAAPELNSAEVQP